MAHLTFGRLRAANVGRCNNSFEPIESWSEGDWGLAMAGEAGETCNLLKKRRRGEDIPLEDVADEIADMVIYADLLAARMGINLEEAVIRKYNTVSDRVGSDFRL